MSKNEPKTILNPIIIGLKQNIAIDYIDPFKIKISWFKKKLNYIIGMIIK